MPIHYRFPNRTETDTVPLSAAHMRVADLKAHILDTKQLTDCDLLLTDAHTNTGIAWRVRVLRAALASQLSSLSLSLARRAASLLFADYVGDDTLVPNGSMVIVRRVPLGQAAASSSSRCVVVSSSASFSCRTSSSASRLSLSLFFFHAAHRCCASTAWSWAPPRSASCCWPARG